MAKAADWLVWQLWYNTSMKKVMVLLLVATAFASFASNQSRFIQKILPAIRQSNQHIAAERQELNDLYRHFLEEPSSLQAKQKTWLTQLAQHYQLHHFNQNNKSSWQHLLRRVNTIPASLALAQAIMESGWGTSRFAKEGNNFFGQWCYRKGCGIVPSRRSKGAIHEVQRFPSVLASVSSYMKNLNTHNTYKDLRTLRFELELNSQPVTGYMLAGALVHYSQMKHGYVRALRTIITRYKLAQYDST